MGAWDAGSFDNDSALDWVGTLRERGDASSVGTALTRAIEKRRCQQPSFIGRLFCQRKVEPYLEADVASQALAAAEIVAFWLGHAAPKLPEELGDWARHHSNSLTPELVKLARQTATTIKTKSELKDLWEEGDGIVAPKWHSAIADLEQRLQSDTK